MRLVLATLLLAAPALAQAGQPAPADAAAQAPAEEKICRRGEVRTGSHLPAKRACHTKAEWAQIDASRQGGEALNALRQNNYANGR